ELQDVAGKLHLLVVDGSNEYRCLAVADELREALAGIADDKWIDIQGRELGLQDRRNRADLLQYPMRNILRRHAFGDQPVDGILGDPARMEQADDQARYRMALHLRIPSGRPRLRRARFQIGHDIDHDSFTRTHRLGERGGDLARPLHPYAADAKAPRHGSKVGWSEADQLLSAARPIAGDAAHAGQVLAEAGIVVDDDSDGDAAPARRFEFGEVVVESAIAGEAQDLPSP